MAEAWRIGTYSTDTLVGKVAKTVIIPYYNNVVAGVWAGVCNGVTYQVTAGKTFHCTGFQLLNGSQGGSAATVSLPIKQADDAAIATGVVNKLSLFTCDAGTLPLTTVYTCQFDVAAGKYIGQISALAGNYGGCVLYGYES